MLVRVALEVEEGTYGFSGREVLEAELRVLEESACDFSIVDVPSRMVSLLNV